MLALRINRRNGDWIGPRSAEAARPPQIRTRHPYHEKSQRDCITLDRTPQLLFAHSACNSAQPNSDCLPRRRLDWAQRASKGISAGSQLRFLEIAAEALDSSDFVSPSKGTFVLYYGMAASQDLGEALRNLARYLKVANESVRVVVCEKADDTVLLVVRKVAKQDERHVVEFV